jgi:hypothetical protein
MDPPKTSDTSDNLRILSAFWQNEMDVRVNNPINTHTVNLGVLKSFIHSRDYRYLVQFDTFLKNVLRNAVQNQIFCGVLRIGSHETTHTSLFLLIFAETIYLINYCRIVSKSIVVSLAQVFPSPFVFYIEFSPSYC